MSISTSATTHLASTAEQEAYLHLQRALRVGRYKPGERLIPEEIAAEIGRKVASTTIATSRVVKVSGRKRFI